MSLMTLFAGSATSGFSPLSIPNLALWLDAADASTFTLDGSSNVEQWRDKSGGAKHAAQGSVLLRPAYTLAAINGLNGVTIDAVDDLLEGPPLLTADVPFTLFGVVRKNAAGTERVAYFIIGADESFGFSVASNTGAFDLSGYLNGAIAWREGPAVGHANGVTLIQELSRTGTTTTMVRYPGAITHSNTDSTSAPPYGNYRIGWQGGAGGGRQNNTIGELLLFERDLSAGEKTDVKTYLSSKWGVAL